MFSFQLSDLNKMLVASNLHEKIFTLYHGVKFYFFFLTLPFFSTVLVVSRCNSSWNRKRKLKGEVYTPWQLLGRKYELCWTVSSENKLMSILLFIKLEKKIRYILHELYSELKMVEEIVESFNRPTSIYRCIYPLLFHWPHLLAFLVIVWAGKQLKIKIFIP